MARKRFQVESQQGHLYPGDLVDRNPSWVGHFDDPLAIFIQGSRTALKAKPEVSLRMNLFSATKILSCFFVFYQEFEARGCSLVTEEKGRSAYFNFIMKQLFSLLT